jgi:4'-phosphopantetheinyl transferase
MNENQNCLWLPAPSNLALSQNDIHVWCVRLNTARPRIRKLQNTLTIEEVKKANRFRSEKDRERHIVARGVLRDILGRYLNTPPEQLRFTKGKHGKPALSLDQGDLGLHFNMSDSHHLVVYAVTRYRQVGIDLEHIQPIPEMEQIVERFFSIPEKEAFLAISPHERLDAFYRGWTRKEAYIKAKGQGLSIPLHQFEVSIASGEKAALLNVYGDRKEASLWSLHEITPAPEYIATIALEGHDWQLSCWQWVG